MIYLQERQQWRKAIFTPFWEVKSKNKVLTKLAMIIKNYSQNSPNYIYTWRPCDTKCYFRWLQGGICWVHKHRWIPYSFPFLPSWPEKAWIHEYPCGFQLGQIPCIPEINLSTQIPEIKLSILSTGWSKATDTNNISLTNLKNAKNGLTQWFLESFYAAVLVFWCLKMTR